MVVLAVNASTVFLQGFGLTVTLSLTVALVQLLFTLVFVTPLWRTVWRWLPKLNDWVYPDLNGIWDVELKSNFSRIDALLKSAKGDEHSLDFRSAHESALPPLSVHKMHARITQSWAKIEMEFWNPDGTGPIKDSTTLMVEPFRRSGGRHGLAYIFDQSNETDVMSDESKFRGAGWIERDRDDENVFSGRMWTDRKWRFGMNTAGEVRFTRQITRPVRAILPRRN
ncbi:MAG: hypothetical protein ACREEK_29020 [Bradyrhizobium sp.]